SEVWLSPNGEVVRLPQREYDAQGQRTNKGMRLDENGVLTALHTTGERVEDYHELSCIRARCSGICSHSSDRRQRPADHHDFLSLRPSGYTDALYIMFQTVRAHCVANLQGIPRSAAVRCGAY